MARSSRQIDAAHRNAAMLYRELARIAERWGDLPRQLNYLGRANGHLVAAERLYRNTTK